MPGVSIYIHFPYCLYKCHYCDFNSHAYAAADIPRADYTTALVTEIRRRRETFATGDIAFFPDGTEVATIFFGGGTPSLMAVRDVELVLSELSRYFVISPATEITLECNPGTVTPQKFRDLLAIGVNRVSIGVQSLDDRYLKVFGRIHSADEARRALNDAIVAGFTRVSGDFIYGFPGQTIDEWRSQLDEIAMFGLRHVSCYALTAEEGTVYARALNDGAWREPDSDTVAAMQEATYALMGARGFTAYEVSNFALPFEECRHNLAYWRYHSFVGIGAGACSQFFAGAVDSADAGTVFTMRRTNHKIPDHYMRTVAANDAYFTAETVSRATALREAIMMGLRTREGVSLAGIKSRFGVDLRDVASSAIALVQGKKWAVLNSARLCPTVGGFLFNNALVREVYTALERGR